MIFLTLTVVAWGEYRPCAENEPIPRVILWGPNNARVWVDFEGFRYNLAKGMSLNKEWHLEDIRRESVLFRRTSDRAFIQMPLDLKEKPRYHREWSFLGDPIGLWEAVEILAKGFGFNVVMHTLAGGPVTPLCHGRDLESILLKTLPSHHRFAIEGPILLVLPEKPGEENWTEVLDRMARCNPENFLKRFPGLRKAGSLFSRGDDIQAVLRQVSLGASVQIQFPKDLHFQVYAAFEEIPFCRILVKIAYLNQCFIVERESFLEIQPWPSHARSAHVHSESETLISGPREPQPGYGHVPPPAPVPTIGADENIPAFPENMPERMPQSRSGDSL